jgi:hypothetical protein
MCTCTFLTKTYTAYLISMPIVMCCVCVLISLMLFSIVVVHESALMSKPLHWYPTSYICLCIFIQQSSPCSSSISKWESCESNEKYKKINSIKYKQSSNKICILSNSSLFSLYIYTTKYRKIIQLILFVVNWFGVFVDTFTVQLLFQFICLLIRFDWWHVNNNRKYDQKIVVVVVHLSLV